MSSKTQATVTAFLIFISALFCYGAFRLGIGRANQPGPGFFPLLTGVVLGLTSLIKIALTWGKGKKTSNIPLFTWQAVFILLILLAFGFFIERIGFYVSAYFASLLFFRAAGKRGWVYVLTVSFVTCVAIFLIFNILLDVRLPLGLLDFIGGTK